MVEGVSGILSKHPKEFRPLYEPSKRRLTWPNGAVATLFNGTEPDQLRGPQFDTAWIDELAKYRYIQELWDMLQFGMRLGDDPEQLITTTPKPLPLIREIMQYPYTHVTRGSTYDNRSNLAHSFFLQVVGKYEGTRLGRQEIEAEILDDVPGAMFSRGTIDRNRTKALPELDRIVVAVDPSGTEGDEEKRSDEVGIVVAGRCADKHGWVIDDRSLNEGPDKWARAVIEAFHEFEADEVVVETNYGGAMVESVLRSVPGGGALPIKKVTASRGKHIRAQPVASLYEQSRVHHLGSFATMEDQLCLFTPDGYMGRTSPDRADALIWAISDLLVTPIRKSGSKEARI
jgi:phage terminase large subunit-like protein